MVRSIWWCFLLEVWRSTMIVLCDRQAVHDLLDKKGSIYSDRPFNYVASHVTNGDSFPFMNNTHRWRSQRKILSHTFSVRLLFMVAVSREQLLTRAASNGRRKGWYCARCSVGAHNIAFRTGSLHQPGVLAEFCDPQQNEH